MYVCMYIYICNSKVPITHNDVNFEILQNVTPIDRAMYLHNASIRRTKSQRFVRVGPLFLSAFPCFPATKRMRRISRDCTPPISHVVRALLRATQLGPRLKVVPEALDAFFSSPNGDEKKKESGGRVYAAGRKSGGEEKERMEDEVVRARENFSVWANRDTG